jgi:hypothetical protein
MLEISNIFCLQLTLGFMVITRKREVIIELALLASIPQAQDKWIKTPGTILEVAFTGHRT